MGEYDNLEETNLDPDKTERRYTARGRAHLAKLRKGFPLDRARKGARMRVAMDHSAKTPVTLPTIKSLSKEQT